LRRVDIFLHGIIGLANRHRLAAEVILVEWNNPPGAPPLWTLLKPREPLGRVTLRVIIVPAEMHRRLPNADQVPFFEPLGKNMALRPGFTLAHVERGSCGVANPSVIPS